MCPHPPALSQLLKTIIALSAPQSHILLLCSHLPKVLLQGNYWQCSGPVAGPTLQLAEGGEARISSRADLHPLSSPLRHLSLRLKDDDTDEDRALHFDLLRILAAHSRFDLADANGRRLLTRAVTLLGVPRCGWGFCAVVTLEPMGGTF